MLSAFMFITELELQQVVLALFEALKEDIKPFTFEAFSFTAAD